MPISSRKEKPMAVEAKRGCGFRKVGGIYLVAKGAWASCDRLPLEVCACPVCGEGVHFPRSPRKVNPKKLFGQHYESAGCTCPTTCQVCNSQDEVAYLLGVGAQYTPESFLLEAHTMGVSKRVPAVPKELKLGETWVYLVHRKGIETGERDPKTGKMIYKMAVFSAFRPQAIEMPVWESELTDERIAAVARGFQRSVVEILVRKVTLAARAHQIRNVVLTGGVAANGALRLHASEVCRDLGLELFAPNIGLCTDNGSMIAFAGFLEIASGERSGLDLAPRASWPI